MTNLPEELFYIAPSDNVYNEILEIAINIWGQYDDTFGYATEKIDYIKGLGNIGSNFMTIYQMFDRINQAKLLQNASQELKFEIQSRQ